jgi:hypothetical protein
MVDWENCEHEFEQIYFLVILLFLFDGVVTCLRYECL